MRYKGEFGEIIQKETVQEAMEYNASKRSRDIAEIVFKNIDNYSGDNSEENTQTTEK